MSYKSYNKALDKLNDKAKQVFKYKMIGKIFFTEYTDDISKAKTIYKFYLYKNDKLIKTLDENDITQEYMTKLLKKYDIKKIDYDLSHLSDAKLDFLIDEP